MNENKLNNILRLSNEDRYWYSIREIVKLDYVWAIATPESWVTFFDQDRDEIFPIWPHKECAEVCLFEELKVEDYSIEKIEFDKFMKYCIPDMQESKILFGVFYNLTKEAYVVDPEQLKNDLLDEYTDS